MVERPQRKTVLVLYDQAFKTGVRRGGGQRVVLQVEQDVDGVRGDDPMD